MERLSIEVFNISYDVFETTEQGVIVERQLRAFCYYCVNHFDLTLICQSCIYQSDARSNHKKNSRETILGFSFAKNWFIFTELFCENGVEI